MAPRGGAPAGGGRRVGLVLFRQPFIEGIASGRITVAFRRWRRPTVRAGGTLITPAGQLAIASVGEDEPGSITDAAARQAGFESREDLLKELFAQPSSTLYRIDFRLLGDDHGVALRSRDDLSEEEVQQLTARLRRLDAAGRTGPWTAAVLALIDRRPGVRAGDLAPVLGQELADFKRNVRKLNALGLTESPAGVTATNPRLSIKPWSVKPAAPRSGASQHRVQRGV
jgi:hypothetical protein